MCNINDWCHVFALSGAVSGCFRNKGPELVGVNSWAEVSVVLLVENSDTEFTVETWMAIL